MIIVNKDVNPERDIYFLGALIIDALKSIPADSVGFFDIFETLNKQKKVTMPLFMLALDWLYLLGVVDSERGLIVKCF